jgi:ketosteroid isomerase-like protein
MKKLFLLPILFLSLHLNAQTETPQQIIEEFFEAFHKKDTSALRSFFDEHCVIRTIAKGKNMEGMISTDELNDFLRMMASIPEEMRFLEQIEEYKVEVDGQLAHVWTPYSFFVNDELSHTGVNSIVLAYLEGWKIVHLIDTRVIPTK